jgi:hypothetical protein
MPLSANPAARSALAYITIGALMDVWAGIWYWYMRTGTPAGHDGSWTYICTGVFLTGLVLMAIGFMVGRIGREARHADAPPAPPADLQRNAVAQAASANNQAAMQANAAGTPMYVVPAGTVAGAMPVAGVPAAGVVAPRTTKPTV